MLPTHGAVTSVFHLANSMRYSSHPDITTWVTAAGTRSSFLAAAIDHLPTAELLIHAGLARPGTAMVADSRLMALSRRADRPTLIAIAALLLEIAPPSWLPVAVFDELVHYEFIPTADLQGLDWLRPELDQLLVDAGQAALPSSDILALGIGRAAELTVFAALDHIQASPIHVSEISDRFGYDIQTALGPLHRWEVKGCIRRTSDSFHLSRNEFEKCRQYPDEWRLVQVEFAPSAVTAELLTVSHISGIRELATAEILAVVPPEDGAFYWETSARLTPASHAWASSNLAVPGDFLLPSIEKLGEQAREMRSEALKRQP